MSDPWRKLKIRLGEVKYHPNKPVLELHHTSLHKKGDRKRNKNYRGIIVTNSVGRLYRRIIKVRTEEDWHDIEKQSGFRSGRSCTDNEFGLRNFFKKRHTWSLETHLAFIDLQKVYGPKQNVAKILEKNTINRHYMYIEAVKHMYCLQQISSWITKMK